MSRRRGCFVIVVIGVLLSELATAEDLQSPSSQAAATPEATRVSPTEKVLAVFGFCSENASKNCVRTPSPEMEKYRKVMERDLTRAATSEENQSVKSDR